MSKVISTLVVLATIVSCGVWFVLEFDGDLTHRIVDTPPAAVPGTVRITRAVPLANDSSSSEPLAAQRSIPDAATSATDAEIVQHAASTAMAQRESATIAHATETSVTPAQTMALPALAAMLPISGTIRQSNAIQLVDWQVGTDTMGHFTFTGQVAHSHLAGPVYSTAVVHLYNSNNRLIGMIPVKDFPRRVRSNVPRTFTLQTNIDASDVYRYAFYINVSRAQEIANEGSNLCPHTGGKTASMSCTPPTF